MVTYSQLENQIAIFHNKNKHRNSISLQKMQQNISATQYTPVEIHHTKVRNHYEFITNSFQQ